MDLIVQINSREALDAALEAGVSGVTVHLPRAPEEAWWAEAAAWQDAARSRGVPYHLLWDRLIREAELPQAQEVLAAVAALNPDVLILRDLGLVREARRRHPELVLQASSSWGLHNSPGLRLAETLGFRRVVLAGPVNLTDLALLRRQTAMPLEVALPQLCPGFGHLCRLDEYLVSGAGCSSPCCPITQQPAAGLLAALELLPGLTQLGVATVHLGGVFSRGEPLGRLIELCRLLEEASPAGRPRVMAAAREVLAAFGEEFHLEFPGQEAQPAAARPETPIGRGSRGAQERPRAISGPSRVWLEARDYDEAAVLAQDWREPLILPLTRENYTAFLGQYRHWHPRRLVWRLPPVLREAALSFFRQAIGTLQQGGFSRFVAGDWGAVALVREVGGEIYGEQTLGVRNSQAGAAARELGVLRVCLPPGRDPQAWQELVNASPRGSFWGYLYHFPTLAVCPAPEAPASAGEKLRWLEEGDLALLTTEVPEHLESCQAWFEQHWVAPLVVSLAHSGLPRGQVPPPARPPRPERQGSGGRDQRPGKAGIRDRGPGGRGQGRQGSGVRGQGSGKAGVRKGGDQGSGGRKKGPS